MEEDTKHTWNYRLLKHTPPGGGPVYYRIHDVNYINGVPASCSVRPCPPVGDTPEEVRADMEQMLEAFEQPVLNYEDF